MLGMDDSQPADDEGPTRDPKKLGEQLRNARDKVGISEKKIHNPTGTYSAHAYQAHGFDNSLDIDEFKRDLSVIVTQNRKDELHFEIIGIDAPIANALRRVLIAEVPTLAIERVEVADNTSIMHDEMLAHRLGLVPLNIDPRPFSTWRNGEKFTGQNSVKFTLKVACSYANPRAAAANAHAPPDTLYKFPKVYSNALVYAPTPGNEVVMNPGSYPGPVHKDLLLAKLRPGQKIDVLCTATKGVGKEHAKWSPVATAFYRMLPEVKMKRKVTGDEAEELVKMCHAKVFDIEDGAVVAKRPRDCTLCRECIRGPERAKNVQLSRTRNHFLFQVESTGALPSATLVTEALGILAEKCNTLEAALNDALLRRKSNVVPMVE